MNAESTELIDLIRCFVTGEKTILRSVDVKKLFGLAEAHNISGICAYVLLQNQDLITPEEAAQMRQICKNTIKQFSLRYNQTLAFLQQLNTHNIDHIVCKGFVVRDYYPIPELRTFGDIDIVIRPEDREKCHELMLQLGFSVKADWEPVFSYYRNTEYYELHTRLMEVDISDYADYQEYFAQCWKYAISFNEHTFRLKEEYLLLYLLTHLAKHIYGSGAGLRMYLDLAFFLKRFHSTLDWEWIEIEIEKLHMKTFTNMVFSFIEKNLGVISPVTLTPVEESVLYDFTEYTMNGGLFGKNNSNRGIQSVKNDDRNNDEVFRGRALLHRLFPKAVLLQQRYTYLVKCPWLLPAAWVHRLVKTRNKWSEHRQEAKDILSADVDEVKKLRKVFQCLGFGDYSR